MIGTSLSHYRIVDQLGRGGMGVVYKAEDTKLDRTVALKLLPPHALASEDDRARFYREARAAAALNHSNIAHVYEIDESDVDGESRPFIAMEYIDGGSLAERIAKGPLSLKDAISVATQVAEGLKAAHQKDIVHRDVKSGNIMLTAAGVPKILDFGLAKTSASTKLTQMGSTLGTVAYMSPEQARGEEVDQRSDVWSLGVILYEMVSGRMPFAGDYEQAVVYGIMNAESEPLTGLRTGVPMELERIVNKCLAKDPARRYQATTDLIVDLENLDLAQSRISGTSVHVSSISAGPGSVAEAAMQRQPAARTRFGLTAAAVGIAGLLLGAGAMWLLRPAAPTASSAPIVTDLVLPEGVVMEASLTAPLQLDRVAISIDPQGKNVVFAGGSGGSTDLYLRSLETGETTKLAGTQGAYGPFFSPDGQWIGFFEGSRLKKVSITGATVVDLAEAALPYGGSWGADGRIVYSTNEGEALAVVNQNGANRRIISVDVIRELAQVAHVGSGGQVLVAARGLIAVDVDTGESRDLGFEASNVALLDDETLLVSREGQLFAVRFDPSRVEIVGDPVQVQSGVLHDMFAHYTVSNSGSLVYAPGPWLGEDRLAWLYEDGSIEIIPQFDAQVYGEFNLAPSADRLAVSVLERPLRTLWVYDFQRGSRIRLTSEGNTGFSTWTPDGRSVVFSTRHEIGAQLLIRSAEGIGAVDTLATGRVTPQWLTPDGERIATIVSGPNGIPDIVIQDLERDAPTEPVTAEPSATEVLSNISADGRFVAYTSDQTGDYQVYVEPFPPTGERWQVSVAGGEEPRWTKDGTRLFYRVGDYLMGVDIDYSGGKPNFSVPDTLFFGRFKNVPGYSYDYDDRNRRWLILRSSETRPEIGHLKVVSNIGARVAEAMALQSR